MSKFITNKVFSSHYFNTNKSDAESHRISVIVFFKSDDLNLYDKERPGQSKKFEDKNLRIFSKEIHVKHFKICLYLCSLIYLR